MFTFKFSILTPALPQMPSLLSPSTFSFVAFVASPPPASCCGNCCCCCFFRRNCQTGPARPTRIPDPLGPSRPVCAHLLIIDDAVELVICAPSGPAESPFRELLREHGALLTFRAAACFTGTLLPRLLHDPILLALPADRLLENGHMFMFSSALLPTLSRVFSFLLSLSPAFMKMSFHRFDAGPGEGEEEEENALALSELSLVLSEVEMVRVRV